MSKQLTNQNVAFKACRGCGTTQVKTKNKHGWWCGTDCCKLLSEKGNERTKGYLSTGKMYDDIMRASAPAYSRETVNKS